MSVRIIILLLLALGSAGGTAFLAQNWLVNERAQIMNAVPKIVEKTQEHKEILVAKADLIPGSFLTKDKLEWQEWPEDALSERMLKKGDVSMEDFEGSVIRSRIPAGQPVMPSAMVKSGERGFLAAVLSPGMRAVTVPLNAYSGVGGFVFPGDRVDVLVNITVKPEGENSLVDRKFHFTETLLKDVRVIGKDQKMEQSEGEVKTAKTATLEVTPKQAEQVALANKIGDVTLSLRSLADENTILSENFNAPMQQHQAAGLEHQVAYVDGVPQPIRRLEIQDEMSLTTDLDVNFFWQKYAKNRVVEKQVKTSRKVQVYRGGAATTREF